MNPCSHPYSRMRLSSEMMDCPLSNSTEQRQAEGFLHLVHQKVCEGQGLNMQPYSKHGKPYTVVYPIA